MNNIFANIVIALPSYFLVDPIYLALKGHNCLSYGRNTTFCSGSCQSEFTESFCGCCIQCKLVQCKLANISLPTCDGSLALDGLTTAESITTYLHVTE